MKKDPVIIYDLQSIPVIVDTLYGLKDQVQVYTFTGSLGAGKTTLVQRLLKQFGVTETITSPTFNYVNTYHNTKKQILYHFDLYRLTSLDEFLIAGFDELLYQDNSWAFIEWPEIVKPLLTHHVCNSTIEYKSENERILEYDVI